MKQVKKGLAVLCMTAIASWAALDARAAEFDLTASASHPPALPFIGAIKDYVVPESVKRAAAMGHTIRWTEAYSGALYDFKNTLEGIEDGLGDLGWVGTLFEPSKLPLQNVTYFAPFVTSDTKLLTEIGTAINEDIPALQAAWAQHNQVFLGIQVSDAYVLITKRPIKSVEDVKGLKLYAPGGLSRWLEGTGAIGVNGSLPVYYNGIQTGIADGAVVPGTGILPFKLHEVAPFVTDVGFGGTIAGALTMNKTSYDRLPPELQQMFRDLGKDYSRLQEEGTAGNRIKHFAILAKQGVSISALPRPEQEKWASLVPDIAGEWVKANEAKGLPAGQVLKTYLDDVRDKGGKPLRDWDK